MRTRTISSRLFASLVGLSLLLAACEDEGNPGDDSLLSGASLIVVLIVVAIVVAVVMSRRRGT
jgi:hypothetical protein